MMVRRISAAAAGALVLGIAAIPLTLSQTHAQGGATIGNDQQPGPGGPRPAQGQGFPGQPQPGFQGGGQGFPGGGPQGPPMGMMGGGGGGGATMVADGDFLFILQGNRLFKVKKSNLEVVGNGQLPMQGRSAGAPGGDAPIGAPTRPAGGGGGTTSK